MAINLNRVILSGNLTRDPELRFTNGGTGVCDIRVAVNGREKVGEEWRDRTEYIDVTVWAAQGEAVAQHLAKGSPVAIDGKLRLDEWTDKDSGDKRSRLKVIADTVQFLPSGSSGDGDGGERQQRVPTGARAAQAQADFGGAPDDDDIPF